MKRILIFIAFQLLCITIYVISAKFGLLFSYDQPFLSSVWPPTGIAFAVLYLYGAGNVFAYFIGAVIALTLHQAPLNTAITVAMWSAIQVLFGVRVVKWYVKNEDLFESVSTTTLFGFTALYIGFSTAALGTVLLYFSHGMNIPSMAKTFMTWSGGEFFSVLLLSPFIISWFRKPTGIPPVLKPLNEKITAFTLTIIVTLVTLGYYHEFRFFILVFLTWISVRFTRKLSTLSTVVVALIAIILVTIHRVRTDITSYQSLLLIQTFLSVAQFNTLILSSLLFKQKKVEQELRNSREFLDEEVKRRTQKLLLSEQRFALALKNTNFVIFNQDKKLRYTWIHNPALGFGVQEVLGKTDDDLFSKKVAKSLYALKKRVLETGIGEKAELNTGTEKNPHIYDMTVEPLKSEDGTIEGITAIAIEITERKQQEEKKDEFISIASHELKTPLTSIKGYVQILERKLRNAEDEQLKKYLSKTNAYIEKLQQLISELLDVSKIQAGKLAMNLEEISFQSFIEETIDNIQYTIPEIKLKVKGKTKSKIKGDTNRLEQVVTNLITNAVKYSPESNKVHIELFEKDDLITVSITDFGIGIPKHELSKVFQRFYRIEKQTKSIAGLGIGLYLSHEIVHRHGGKMWVESELGTGSTFSFSLPILKTRKQ